MQKAAQSAAMFSSRTSPPADMLQCGMVWSIGDIVTTELKNHYVYELLDDFGLVFYVGVTNNPPQRLRAHQRSDVSVIRLAVLDCRQARMLIVAGPMSRSEAEAEERRRISETPALLNHHCKPRDIEAQRTRWRNKKRRQRARRRQAK